MTSTYDPSSPSTTSNGAPALPPNVSIFSPAKPINAKALLNGHVFTRLTVSTSTSPAQLASALNSAALEAFCFWHRNVILIFDGDDQDEGKDIQDAHHEHFRTVCLALKEKEISVSVSGCIYDAKDALGAGFQLDELSSGSVLVIDLMDGQDDDDDSEDDDDDDDEDEDEEDNASDDGDKSAELQGKEEQEEGGDASLTIGGS
ncbi:hypothetical protein BDV96DRAFT_571448 [Lophiotrema nucula]|uniref:Uncharacterized protein n=1 Tax=Lophiotrema nucula TaxID=690887 RepID=A0A6A5ZCW2_9PLEO|nr:hypothetical protein BDV96DRAFT_571448 [Lophiotrema nucula]